MNKFTQVASEATTVETVATVEILSTFYKALVDHAHSSFLRVDFKEIRETLLTKVTYSESTEELVKIAENFLDETQFVEAVVSERTRLNEVAKSQARTNKRTNGVTEDIFG